MKLKEVQENPNISEEGDRKFQYNSLIKFDKLFEGDGEIENKFTKEESKKTLTDIRNKFDKLFEGDNLQKEDIDASINVENEEENSHQKNIDGKTYYYDDNGKEYRVENDLKPNTDYEINGYRYKTDEQGRIVSAEGSLHMKEREVRLPIKDSLENIGKGDEKEGDDRGHLIGDQFDGTNRLENMIPQDANINRNDFKNFENELAKEVKEGKQVEVKIEPVYEENSRRPEAIVVTYSIDKEESIRVFPNGQEG